MPFEVVMPRLGWNMEKGTLVRWFKADGDYVQAGEILFAVEADKATQEIESLDNGFLRIPAGSPGPGSAVPVGTLLAYLLQPGEAEPSGAASAASLTAPDSRPVPAVAVGAANQAATTSRVITEGSGRLEPAISPRARRVAKELAVEWGSLKGSGRTGRIVERDIRRASAQAQPAEARSPVKPMGALAVAPPPSALMLSLEADATELVRACKQLTSDASRPAPSYFDLMVALLARALADYPALNSQWEGDALVQVERVNLGLAVDSGAGRLIPVLRDIRSKTLLQISRESAALIEAARAGRLPADDVSGASFNFTDLSMNNIDTFTPEIHAPACATLGMGRIVPKQVVSNVDNGRVDIRHMMFLSLSLQRGVLDEDSAARFLNRIRQLVEQPYLLLM